MTVATAAQPRSANTKLMVVDGEGRITHRRRAELVTLVRRGDLVVANDAATLPASLFGIHTPTGAPIELRLAGRPSLRAEEVTRFTAVAFGAGDFRMRTESRPLPPVLNAGDTLQLGPLRAVVEQALGHPRLIDIEFQGSTQEIWEGLARHGHPIQYSYVSEPLSIRDTWTRIAGLPVAFEPPSAGFVLDWQTIAAFRTRGAGFATLTHAAGISSTGDDQLDARLPLDEPYEIPAATARLIRETRRAGGRIVAVGTTVVRALENAAAINGCVRAGVAIATLRIGQRTPLRVVSALVTGQHEPGTSHYELLRAFQPDDVLGRITAAAAAHSYRSHEFGDALFMERAGAAPTLLESCSADVPEIAATVGELQ